MSQSHPLLKQLFARGLIERARAGEAALYVLASSVSADSAEDRSEKNSQYDTHNGALFGKKVQRDDINLLVKKYEWSPGAVFSEYDDRDPNLPERKFFTMVRGPGGARVFKCISNNNGSPSLYSPDISSSAVYGPFSTADGYTWVLMYEITAAELTKFESETHIPVFQNEQAAASAVPGAVDHIKIQNAGSGYPWARGTIRRTTDPRKWEILLDSALAVQQDRIALHATSGFYSRCAIKLTTTTGTEVAQIPLLDSANALGHINEGGRVFVYFAEPRNNIIDESMFEIGPWIQISAYNRTDQDELAVAFPVMSNNGAISRVEVVRSGSGYNGATVSVVGSPGYGKNAVLRAIVSPENGHGSDAERELFAKDVGVHATFQTTEGFEEGVQYNRLSLVSGLEPLFSITANIDQSYDYRLAFGDSDYNQVKALFANTAALCTIVDSGDAVLADNVMVANSALRFDDSNRAVFVSVSDDVDRTLDPSNFSELVSANTLVRWQINDASGPMARSTANTEWLVGRNVSLIRYTSLNNSTVVADGNVVSANVSPTSKLLSLELSGFIPPSSTASYFIAVTDDGDGNPSTWKYSARVDSFQAARLDFIDRLWEVRLNSNTASVGQVFATSVTDRLVTAVKVEGNVVHLAGMDDENGAVLLSGPTSLNAGESLIRLSDQTAFQIQEIISAPNAKYGKGDVLYVNNTSATTVNRDRLKLTIIT